MKDTKSFVHTLVLIVVAFFLLGVVIAQITTHTEEEPTNTTVILLDRTSGAYRIDGDGCTAQEFAGGALVNINCQ